MPTLGRELHGVGQQVPEHLFQAPRIALQHGHGQVFRVDADLFLARHRLDGFAGALQHVGQIDFSNLQRHLARQDGRHVEQVVDQVNLRAGAALDGGQATLEHGLVVGAHIQQLGPAQHGIERRAQFVADGGEEVVLQAAGAFGLFTGARFGFKQLRAAGFGLAVSITALVRPTISPVSSRRGMTTTS